MGALVEIKDMCKIYNPGENEVRALDHVNVSIDEGEFVAIIGQSGSGKSTLMNMLGCLDVPTSRLYMLHGQDVSGLLDDELSDIRNHEIGFVFQGFNLIQNLTALENVELPLIYRGVSRGKRLQLAASALAKVGLENRIDHRPAEMSGGQQQRVAIARAIAQAPPIILADEPTGNLDSGSTKEIMEIMQELHKEGRTVILITHNNEIAVQANRIIKIRDGRIESDTAVPVIGNVEEEISTSGTVASEEIKFFFAPVSGKLSEINVEAGDVVKTGDILVSYDMDFMEETLTLAELQYLVSSSNYQNSLSMSSDAQRKLNEANTNIPILEQQIADTKDYIKTLSNKLSDVQTDTSNSLAAENLKLQKKLIELQKNPIANADAIAEVQIAMQNNQYISQVSGTSGTQADLQKEIRAQEELLAGYQKYKAKMDAQKQQAEAQVLSNYQITGIDATETMNANTYEGVQTDFDTAEFGINATFDGVVTDVTAIEGATVTEGMQLLTLANSEKIKVSFFVTRYDLAKIAVGQTADVTINNKVYKGTIAKINRMATVNPSGTAMVGAEIHIENPDDNIYLGLDAKLEIHTNKAENVLLFPIEALNADKEGDFVYIEENGYAVRKPIVTGLSSTEYIEVKEGLSETDHVIISSFTGTGIEEGMQVYVMPETE